MICQLYLWVTTW